MYKSLSPDTWTFAIAALLAGVVIGGLRAMLPGIWSSDAYHSTINIVFLVVVGVLVLDLTFDIGAYGELNIARHMSRAIAGSPAVLTEATRAAALATRFASDAAAAVTDAASKSYYDAVSHTATSAAASARYCASFASVTADLAYRAGPRNVEVAEAAINAANAAITAALAATSSVTSAKSAFRVSGKDGIATNSMLIKAMQVTDAAADAARSAAATALRVGQSSFIPAAVDTVAGDGTSDGNRILSPAF